MPTRLIPDGNSYEVANDHTDLGADLVRDLNGHGKLRHPQPVCPFTLVFIASIFAIIILGLTHRQPIATIGAPQSLQPVEALSVILTLKASPPGVPR